MKIVKPAVTALAAAAVYLGGALIPADGESAGPVRAVLGSSAAEAGDMTHGEIRRTVRRVDRRQDRREARREARMDTLTPDCVAVMINGFQYWNCSGVHYQIRHVDGRDVYVIVNP